MFREVIGGLVLPRDGGDIGSRTDRIHASERSVWPLGSMHCQLLAWNDAVMQHSISGRKRGSGVSSHSREACRELTHRGASAKKLHKLLADMSRRLQRDYGQPYFQLHHVHLLSLRCRV